VYNREYERERGEDCADRERLCVFERLRGERERERERERESESQIPFLSSLLLFVTSPTERQRDREKV
jgi:hypothetical protein